MRIIKKDLYKKIPWKNGLGFTREIAIFPKGTTVSNNDFLWRVSSASIEKNSDFSPFPGYNRDLLLLDGSIRLTEVLTKHSTTLSPLEPFSFSGDISIRCELIARPAQDLNIFTKREDLTRNVRLIRFRPNEELSFALKGDWNLVYLATGKIEGNEAIPAGDTIILDSKNLFGLKALSAGALVIIEIFQS